MTATRIPGAGGVLRMTWVQDWLGHVREHSHVDEPLNSWTALACPMTG